MERKQFVETLLSDTISTAVTWIDHLEYDEDRELVAIVCDNGHRYYANGACDSNRAVIQDVMKEVVRH